MNRLTTENFMALSQRNQTIFWSITALVFFLVLWGLGQVLLPFVLGIAIAYLLDPLADRLEALGLSRSLAVLTIFGSAIIVILPLVLFVLSELIDQISELSSLQFSPEKIQELESRLIALLPASMSSELNLQQSFDQFAEFIRPRAEQFFNSFGKNILGALMTSAMSLINIIVLLVIVPVVTVYMLLDWDRMIARIDALLPLDHADTIRALAREIDDTLSAFVRGMGSVCLILGTYYAIALWIVGLDFGFAVGFFAGLVTFIPYVGSLVGGALAIGLGIFEFWGNWTMLAVIAGIFFAGQVFEGNYLTPKLVGGSVGLHPIWLLLALSVFGNLFGFVGMLVAVPVAASLGVLVRFAAGQYTSGRLYKGTAGKNSDQ